MSLLNAELKRLNAKQGVKFETGFMNLGAKKLMTPDVLLLMRSENNVWKVDYKLYEAYHFDKIFEFMRENNAEVLLFNDNYRPSILCEMKRVVFHQLLDLNLTKNSITCIEPISEINAPKLRKLDLSQNLITTVRALNRLVSSLTSLKINDNPIVDVERLARCSFAQLQELDLETKPKQPIVGESLVWLMRFPSKQLAELRCASRKRIKQHWLYRQLAQKYPRGRIALH